MKKIVFAIDKNLNLSIEDEEWQKFFKKFNIVTSLYTDMKQLTEDMEKNKIELSYLPSANFFYLRSDAFYVPLANALYQESNTPQLTSLLIVSKKNPINTLEELKGKTYGYIHPYCTSSYFAMALLLWRHQFSIHNFYANLKEVGPWQLQIDAVVSGKVDATMVPHNVWNHLPSNEINTKIIATEARLPSPVIIVSKQLDPLLLSVFKELLFSYRVKSGIKTMFDGFVPFQKEQNQKFFSESEQALASLL